MMSRTRAIRERMTEGYKGTKIERLEEVIIGSWKAGYIWESMAGPQSKNLLVRRRCHGYML
jgi:hypothetical protein